MRHDYLQNVKDMLLNATRRVTLPSAMLGGKALALTSPCIS
jgi:hypothetical protein